MCLSKYENLGNAGHFTETTHGSTEWSYDVGAELNFKNWNRAPIYFISEKSGIKLS